MVIFHDFVPVVTYCLFDRHLLCFLVDGLIGCLMGVFVDRSVDSLEDIANVECLSK